MGANLSPRQLARQYAVKGMYQWELNRIPDKKIINFQEVSADSQKDLVDKNYLSTLISGTILNQVELDEGLAGGLDRPISDVDPVELSILRVAAYELKEELSVPYRVIINEAIELAKYFSSSKSHQFVNGVLDRCGKHWRPEAQ